MPFWLAIMLKDNVMEIEAGKYYLTKEGLSKIKKEHDELLKLKKMKAKEGAPSLLHSEELNSEFVAYREDFEYLEAKIEELEKILNNFELIKKPPKKEQDRINLGAKVTIEVNGAEDEFMLVGTMEASPLEGRISNESPVGKALIGHKVGDEIFIDLPTKISYKIKKIKY